MRGVKRHRRGEKSVEMKRGQMFFCLFMGKEGTQGGAVCGSLSECSAAWFGSRRTS